ncbi:MAG: DMT family transporter [Streptosporangiales bacterium]
MRRAIDWRLRFAALALMWGTSFWFIKVAVEVLAPLQITLGRCAVGALAVASIVAIRRQRLPGDPRVWAHLAVAALLLNVVPFTLFGYAEQRIPSALAGICNATTPLFTVLIGLAALPDERPTRRRVAGLVLGFGGVLLVLGVWQGLAGDTAGTLMAVLAAASYGAGWVYVRRFVSGRGLSTFVVTATQLIAATAQLVVLNLAFTDAPTHLPARAVLAVLVLGALGTGLAYVVQHGLIRDAGATVASTVTYLVPVVAVAVGVGLLDEHLSWNEPLGAAVVLAGAVLVGQRGARARARRRAERKADELAAR